MLFKAERMIDAHAVWLEIFINCATLKFHSTPTVHSEIFHHRTLISTAEVISYHHLIKKRKKS